MVKLDVKDKKLLYYLSQDCRQSDTQLSRKIQLSKNGVKYRKERLVKEGVITKFASVVNIGKLNLETIGLLLKFNEDIYEKKEIIEYFKNNNLVNWVVTLSGQWDLFVEVIIKDYRHSYKIINEIIERFSGVLNTYKTFFSMDILRVEHLIADFYKDLELEEPVLKKRGLEIYKIDKIDKSILHILNQDSSLPYLQIAQRLGVTIDVVRYRIRNMVGAGVIIKFFSDVSLSKLGYTKFLYTIKLKNISKDRVENIKKRIQVNSNITYAFFDIISLNLVFICAFKDISGIDHLSRSLRKEFKDIIEEQDYLIIKEDILFNLFPKGLLEL